MVKENIQIIVKNITADYLMNYPAAIQIKEGIKVYQKVQETLLNYVQSKDEADLMMLKVGTALTWEVVNCIAQGKSPKEFTKDDWERIAVKAADNSINIDGQEYSKRVFLTYADYIEVSAKVVENAPDGVVPKENIAQIKALAKEIRSKSEMLDEGIVSEVGYIDDCLWLSLEAMIKLLSVTAGKYACSEVKIFIDGVTQYAFEYGRLALYQQEQALLDEILVHQGKVDTALTKKYEDYIKTLYEKTEAFNILIDEAFASDFSTRLKGSVALARAAGVNEDEILDSVDKIDDFFN